jgi:hypothetical protein
MLDGTDQRSAAMTKSKDIYQYGEVVAKSLVDEDDYDRLSQHRWHIHKVYAIRWESVRQVGAKRKWSVVFVCLPMYLLLGL